MSRKKVFVKTLDSILDSIVVSILTTFKFKKSSDPSLKLWSELIFKLKWSQNINRERSIFPQEVEGELKI